MTAAIALAFQNTEGAGEPRRRHWLDTLAITLMILAIGFITLLAHSPFSLGLLAGAVVLAIYGLRTGQKDLIAIAPFLPAFGLVAWWANYGVYLITPRTIDQTLLRLDCGVGLAVFHWTLAHPAIEAVLRVVYFSLGLAAGIVISTSRRRPELLRACVIAALVAPLFYILFPAVGPCWIGHAAARNCVPSLHMTWAFLLLIYSSPRLRLPATAFAFLTAAATMGLGEHYAIDLVAAVPFAAGVCWLASWKVRR